MGSVVRLADHLCRLATLQRGHIVSAAFRHLVCTVLQVLKMCSNALSLRQRCQNGRSFVQETLQNTVTYLVALCHSPFICMTSFGEVLKCSASLSALPIWQIICDDSPILQ